MADLDLALARETVAANAATVERAVAFGRLQPTPDYHDLDQEAELERILQWQQLAKLLRLRGLTRLEDGDGRGAHRIPSGRSPPASCGRRRSP